MEDSFDTFLSTVYYVSLHITLLHEEYKFFLVFAKILQRKIALIAHVYKLINGRRFAFRKKINNKIKSIATVNIVLYKIHTN